MAIPSKYSGKSFAEVATELTDIYKDRFDPISRRGLSKTISELRQAQEHKKSIEAAKEQLQAELSGVPQTPQAAPQVTPQAGASNQGVSFNAPEQEQTFKREASSDYNNKFGDGGKLDATKDFLNALPPKDQRMLFDETLELDNPITGNKMKYGEFREYMLTNRDKVNKYLEDNRMESSPEAFVSEEFEKARQSFLKNESNQKNLAFDQELLKKVFSEGTVDPRKNTKLQKYIESHNKQLKERGEKILDFNKLTEQQVTERLSKDQAEGLRDQWGNMVLNENAYGGEVNTYEGGGYAGLAMQAAPIITNLIEYFTTKKPDPVKRRQVDKGFLDNLRSFKPRQSTFKDVDINDIERGIVEGSGRFSQANKQASRGSSSAFIANEIANQSNLSKAIAQARMNAQIQDRQTAQLRAGEQGRIDSILGQQNAQAAQMEGQINVFNTRMQHQADVEDAQNQAAYAVRRSQLLNSAAQGLSSVGNTVFTNAQMQNVYGYNILGKPTGRGGGETPNVVDSNLLASNPYYQLGQSQQDSRFLSVEQGGESFAHGGFINKLRKLKGI